VPAVLAFDLGHTHARAARPDVGGLRGALALALALALPQSFPFHNEVLVTAFGVVIFSVIVQGPTTMPKLLQKLNLLPRT
jgi:monovalent cation:H+ antiporter, CPA1 family